MKKGFTLVELLLYMGIFSILLSILSTLFVNIIDINLSSKSVSLIDIDANILVSKLKNDIRDSTSISTPNTIGQITNDLVLVNSDGNINYSALSGEILRSQNSEQYKINSNLIVVNSIQFKKTSGDSVLIIFELQSVPTPIKGVQKKTFSTLVTAR